MPVSDQLSESYASTGRRAGVLNRAFDFVCAAIGLLFLSPLLLIAAAAIVLDDGGPVFYRQARVGREFRSFEVLKFRSMMKNADRSGLLTTRDDPRLTRIGRWLRRSKIDELPQLWNVLKGDMQLVGPRPEVERYVQMFRPQYAALLLDRPGITDPASLAYRREEKMRSDLDPEETYVSQILPAKLQLSLDYQQHRSLWSDLRILLHTAWGLIY